MGVAQAVKSMPWKHVDLGFWFLSLRVEKPGGQYHRLSILLPEGNKEFAWWLAGLGMSASFLFSKGPYKKMNHKINVWGDKSNDAAESYWGRRLVLTSDLHVCKPIARHTRTHKTSHNQLLLMPTQYKECNDGIN